MFLFKRISSILIPKSSAKNPREKHTWNEFKKKEKRRERKRNVVRQKDDKNKAIILRWIVFQLCNPQEFRRSWTRLNKIYSWEANINILKNYNFLACDWFKNVLFSTNSLAKLLSDSLLLDSLLLDSLLSDSLISQSHSKM